MKDELDTTDVKAVRRMITNVYSKGTYNPSVSDDVKMNLGNRRTIARNPLKYDEVMED